MVGEAVAGRLASLGHEVRMGARDPANPKARAWAAKAGGGPRRDRSPMRRRSARWSSTAHAGSAAIEVLRAAGRENLRGKVLVDVSNPLEFPPGAPPKLFTAAAGDSLAERIQAGSSPKPVSSRRSTR